MTNALPGLISLPVSAISALASLALTVMRLARSPCLKSTLTHRKPPLALKKEVKS